MPGLVASALAAVDLAPRVEWTALAAVVAILVAALIRAMRGVDDLPPRARPPVLATLASALGDRQTLEAVLAGTGAAYFHPEEVELFRATAERAAGDAEAGTRRLRELDAPPARPVAATAAKRLEHPTPAFDGRHLDGAAGRGLERYRRLAARARRP